MKKGVLFVVLALLLTFMLSMPVFAASDSGGFWDIADTIGGFFSDLGSAILDGLMQAADFLLDGLRWLFLPRDGYFQQLSTHLHEALGKKFGSFINLANYLKERFGNLKAFKGDLLVLKFPKGHLFSGARIDLLSGAGGITSMIRGAFSGAVVLFTVAFAYKKVSSMINT